MRSIFITVLMLAIVLTGFRFFLSSDTTGLWHDSKEIKDKKDTKITQILAPAP